MLDRVFIPAGHSGTLVDVLGGLEECRVAREAPGAGFAPFVGT